MSADGGILQADPRVARLGPHQALELAILGVADHGPVELDRLTGAVQQMGGCCWHPTADVILGGVERLLNVGGLSTGEIRSPALGLVLETTRDGKARLRALLRAEIAPATDFLCHTYVMLKVAFLDRLDLAQRCTEADRLLDLLRQRADAFRSRAELHTAAGPLHRLAVAHEIHQLNGDVAWLSAIRNSLVRDSAA